MHSRVRLTALLAFVVFAVAPIARADDASDVKAVFKTLVQDIAQNKTDEAFKLVSGDDKQHEFVQAQAQMYKGRTDYESACKEKFGVALTPTSDSIARLTGAIDAANVSVQGESATLKLPTSDPAKSDDVVFKKVGGQWTIQQLVSPDALGDALPRMEALAKAFSQTASDVRSGKLKTMDQARGALSMNYHSTTAPSGQGTSGAR